MDLYAYTQIGELDKIAQDNGIVVPRLRGYRLMKDERPVSTEEMREMQDEAAVHVCERICCTTGCWIEYSDRTKRICNRYLIRSRDEDGYEKYSGIRWDRVHGKKRKAFKLAIKQKKKAVKKQYDMWNKYVDNEDVLYIHARIGSGSWAREDGEKIMNEPWFLDKADDYFDNSYCDIYASIAK